MSSACAARPDGFISDPVLREGVADAPRIHDNAHIAAARGVERFPLRAVAFSVI